MIRTPVETLLQCTKCIRCWCRVCGCRHFQSVGNIAHTNSLNIPEKSQHQSFKNLAAEETSWAGSFLYQGENLILQLWGLHVKHGTKCGILGTNSAFALGRRKKGEKTGSSDQLAELSGFKLTSIDSSPAFKYTHPNVMPHLCRRCIFEISSDSTSSSWLDVYSFLWINSRYHVRGLGKKNSLGRFH
jgi:hypothetical protein